MIDLTFADYLVKINIIPSAINVDPKILLISLDDFYECYVNYCKKNNYIHEDLSYEFYQVTGRNEIREISYVTR